MIPRAPWFQLRLERKDSLIVCREVREMEISSSRDKSEGLEKPEVLLIVDSFFLRPMTERK